MINNSIAEKLRTVQLVPLTAYDEQGRLSLEPMQQLTERSLEAGIRVFIPCAGSAEFHSLSDDEIIASVEMTHQTVGDNAITMAPIGHQLHNAIELGERAVEAGADCLLVMPLSFPYLSDAGAYDYFTAILDRLERPVLVYKKAEIPSDDLLLELASHPNLAGVKYAINDIDAFNRIVQDDRHGIEWICGSAERFSPFFSLVGATGYTSGAGNICPRVTLAMHSAINSGDWSEALRLQQIIRPIEDYRARSGSSYNISFLKHAVKQTGLDFGIPRPPQRQLTLEEMNEIDRLIPPILDAEKELLQAAAVG